MDKLCTVCVLYVYVLSMCFNGLNFGIENKVTVFSVCIKNIG